MVKEPGRGGFRTIEMENIKLDGIRIIDICNHYKPAVIYQKGNVKITRSIFGIKLPDKENQSAYSLLKKIGGDEYKCSHCGVRLSEKEKAHIDKIVDYLNSGGNSDRKLSAMFKGIPMVQTFKDGHKTRTEIVKAERGYVPAKNDVM